jgi:hypothetical protein
MLLYGTLRPYGLSRQHVGIAITERGNIPSETRIVVVVVLKAVGKREGRKLDPNKTTTKKRVFLQIFSLRYMNRILYVLNLQAHSEAM